MRRPWRRRQTHSQAFSTLFLEIASKGSPLRIGKSLEEGKVKRKTHKDEVKKEFVNQNADHLNRES